MTLDLPLISVNGKLGATLSVLDRGFAYGDGLFETCRYTHGSIPLWSYHLERLLHGANCLAIPLETILLNQYLEELLAQVRLAAIMDGVIKITVTRGVGGRGASAPTTITPTYAINFFAGAELRSEEYRNGVNVRICDHRLSLNNSLAGIKHLNRLDYVLARLEWDDQKVGEGLLLDVNDKIIEGTITNLFLVKDRKLFTSDLSHVGVLGVMRRLVLEKLAPSLGLDVSVQHLVLDNLLAADEVFLCNSVCGIWPVKKVLELKDYFLSPQSITRELQNAYEQSLFHHA